MPNQNEYIGTPAVAQAWACAEKSVFKVATTAGIRIRNLPGMPIRYHKGDVEALAAQSFVVASQSTLAQQRQTASV